MVLILGWCQLSTKSSHFTGHLTICSKVYPVKQQRYKVNISSRLSRITDSDVAVIYLMLRFAEAGSLCVACLCIIHFVAFQKKSLISWIICIKCPWLSSFSLGNTWSSLKICWIALLSVIHYTICGAVCFQFTHFPCDDCENMYTLSYYHHQIGRMNYYPLLG